MLGAMDMSMPWLAFVIQIPVFAIIGWLFARGRPARWVWPVLLGTLVLTFATTIAVFHGADRSYGLMWPQVLAAVLGYGVFLAGVGLGWLLPWLVARQRR